MRKSLLKTGRSVRPHDNRMVLAVNVLSHILQSWRSDESIVRECRKHQALIEHAIPNNNPLLKDLFG